MLRAMRRLRRDISGATSIEMAGMALVSVLLISVAAKSVGTRVMASFEQSVGTAFGNDEPSVNEVGRSRVCRAADAADRPECRTR